MKFLFLATLLYSHSIFANENSLLTEEEERKLISVPHVCQNPHPRFSKSSSHEEFAGVGGDRGKACPSVELFWLSGAHYSAMCFKDLRRVIHSLGSGQAKFNADCSLFWSARAEGVAIYEVQTGKILWKTAGDLPEWTPKGDALLFEWRKKKKGGLKKMDVKTGKVSPFFSVEDFGICHPPGEGITYGTIILQEDKVVWTYPTTKKGSGKKLTLGLKTGKLEKTELVHLECD